MSGDVKPAKPSPTKMERAIRVALVELDQPKGAHSYIKGIHNPDCSACYLRHVLREGLL